MAIFKSYSMNSKQQIRVINFCGQIRYPPSYPKTKILYKLTKILTGNVNHKSIL